jgi:adenosylcobinamide-phosphate synthase
MIVNTAVLAPIVLAVALDLAFGDPPNKYHPVAWMGSALMVARQRLPTRGKLLPWLCGALLMGAGLVVAVAIGLGIDQATRLMPLPLALVVEAIVLKSLFSIKGLVDAARAVASALSQGDLAAARGLASWHLVGRTTDELDAPRIAAAAIESIAENSSDSIVAPLFYYGLCGLSGALAYRLINTADSILGYRDADREWLGKVPARLDDLANLIPARLTAVLIILVAPSAGGHRSQALRTWWRDARQTASPNAGHPMSAAAGALGVELEKIGAYRLGAGLRLPGVADIGRAIRLLSGTIALALIPIAILRLFLANAR